MNKIIRSPINNDTISFSNEGILYQKKTVDITHGYISNCYGNSSSFLGFISLPEKVAKLFNKCSLWLQF